MVIQKATGSLHKDLSEYSRIYFSSFVLYLFFIRATLSTDYYHFRDILV